MTERDPTRIPRIALRVAALGALAFSAATVAEYFVASAGFCPPDGGCADVRQWAFGQTVGGFPLGMLLPVLGVMCFTALFAGSLFRDRLTSRVVGALAVLGALGAVGLLYLQATTIGAWCWLCVGVDSFALLAGAAGVALLVITSREPVAKDAGSMRSPWWAGWVLVALAPIAWAFTLPDPPVPDVIHDLYEDGAINVVEVADFECPYCRALHPVLKSALEDAEGEVNLVRVIVPLAFHTHARGAARAYYCGVRMERGEDMADALFAADDLSRRGTVELARELGLDPTAFERCLDDPEIEARIREDERIAEASQNQGLPTVYIGERVLLGFDASKGEAPFRDAIDAASNADGARVRYWPLTTVVLLAAAAAALGRRKKA